MWRFFCNFAPRNKQHSNNILKERIIEMRKVLKTTIIAALAATTFSSAVQAQSTISKRERILQVLDQSRPNEYVPAAFFLHFL